MVPRSSVARTLVAGLALSALACGRAALEPCPIGATSADPTSRNVDLLFMIDNSPETPRQQAKLIAGFPGFLAALTSAAGGAPSLHLAVVSSDMGAGTGVDGCAGNGQAGLFQWGGPGFSCPATTDGARFLSNVRGAANYTAPLADLFSCLAALGEDGCGFEQPLLSIAHALGADNFDSHGTPQPPLENQGFLRDDAVLAIVMLSNEDDCSAPGGASSDLFPRAGDGSDLMSALGPPSGYRCNEFGHLCGNPAAPPPRLPPGGDNSAVVELTDCVPAEGAGRLVPVADFAAAIKALKRDPLHQIVVAAITGVYPVPGTTQGYAVDWWPAPPHYQGYWPMMKHECTSSDASWADPAVRTSAWVRRFADHGLLQSICDDDWTPALQQIGTAIGSLAGAGGQPSDAATCPG
jgi:hypothetical protein